MMLKHSTICVLVLCLLHSTISHAQSGVIPVTLQQNVDGTWQLMREGKPYYIQGVGGQTELEKAKEIGANTIRTWSTDNAGEVLDAAYKQGLTVMLGLWAQHERHGFNYDDTTKVRAQLNYFTEVVQQYKDHPALLLWGIGNEVDLFYTNTNVWYAINDIAEMIHRIDPNHPTSTVTAGLDPAEVKLINERAPAIDIYGVNTYGDIGNVKEKIKQYGWNGPYMITEWGPNGHWEVEKTIWKAPIEQSSTEKAQSYRERYTSAILGDKPQCIGSFVFLWGFKQETTSTWYGMFDENGASSEAVDVLAEYWNPTALTNTAPSLDSARLDGKMKGESILFEPDTRTQAIVYCRDKENDKLKYVWEVVPESRDIKAGGDAESRPTALKGIKGRKKLNTFSFLAPQEEGAYRLFIYVYDGNNHYAYCNIPFYVKDSSTVKPKPLSFKKQQLSSR